MLLNIVADIAKMGLFIVCAYALLGAFARWRRRQWAEHLTKRRPPVLGLLTLAVGGIKLIENVDQFSTQFTVVVDRAVEHEGQVQCVVHRSADRRWRTGR